MKEIIEKINALQAQFTEEAAKALNGNAAAGVRARKASKELSKLYLEFRKVSVVKK